MPQEQKTGGRRVSFEHGIPANIMAIDGTWQRACSIDEVSDYDATLTIEGSVRGLALEEFFLLLSSTGLTYRRCQLEQMNGGQMTVRFLKHHDKQKKPKDTSTTT